MKMLKSVKQHTIAEYEIDEILLWIMGFLSPMLLLYFGGNSIFMYLMLLSSGWCIFNIIVKYHGNILLSPTHYWMLLLSALSFVSITICIIGPLEEYWKDGEKAQYIWVIIYLIFFVFYSSYYNREYVLYYIKGVYISAIFQLIWSIVQYIVYVKNETALNDIVFGEWLHMENPAGNYTAYRGASISLSGLCWHPSNLAPLLTIGYCFSNNIFVKLAFVLVAVLSANRTTLIGMIICIVVDVFMNLKRIFKPFSIYKWRFLLTIAVIIAAVIYFLYVNTSVIDRVSELRDMYWDTIVNMGRYENDSYDAHIDYWIKTPLALKSTPIINVLFGYGPNCSGYMGTKYTGLYVGQKWVLECDYLDCLWGTGVLGFVVRYAFFAWGAVKVIKKEKRLLPLILSFAVMGITYNFICTWCLLFVYCLIIYYGMDGENECQ